MRNSLIMQILILSILLALLVIAGITISLLTTKFETKDYEFSNISDYKKLTIDCATADVEIKKYNGDTIKIETETYGNNKIVVTDENNEFKIYDKGRFFIINIGIIKRDIIKVYLPENLELEHNYKLSSGRIKVSDINMSNLSFKITSGKINIDDIKTNDINGRITSGKIIIEDTISDSLKLTSTSGSIKYFGTANSVDIRSTSGFNEVNLDNAPSDLNAKLTSGTIKVTIPDNEGFTLQKDITSGSFKSDFEYMIKKNKYIYGNGNNNYKIKITSGTIRLYQK